ncbi:hypothetical protein GCM10010495_71460 [Kitasatospora herbaricolor]|uniref:DUF1707 SHOCT-like domain-containing protein n=1 Tax=Kitasatospora herbaricolor TaxID=68217 RepID=UPI00198B55BE|nr:hypothetical protein [Kitasatospora herbaricolor]GGV43576.1 hypothetical protein GCM10010495_71460 [Kitasatospora herbaricolor]
MDNSPSQDDQPQDDQGHAPVPMTKPEPVRAPARTDAGAPVAEAEMRASDADRERVAELLRDAYAEGRLNVDEHAERIEAAYGAKTLGELAPLTRDLPAHGSISFEKPPLGAPVPVPRPPARQEAPTMLAVFGGASRKGRWRVGSHLRAVAVFGGIEIDLTDAVFESPEVVIEVAAVFGGVEIKVPENVSLHGGGVGIFGGFDVKEQTAADPYAPVVRVKGAAVFGGCEAKPRKGKKLKEWVRKQLGT